MKKYDHQTKRPRQLKKKLRKAKGGGNARLRRRGW
jgi:hypothetical protein